MKVKVAISTLLALLLTGCVTTPPNEIITTSTPFHGVNHAERGTITVQPIDKTQEGSLEFNTVVEYVLVKFRENGYVPLAPNQNSNFVAYITYGIDNGKTTNTTVPIYGPTGGGTTFSSGTVTIGSKVGNYSGSSTTMPTYGMVGVVPYQDTTYKRLVNIDVYRKQDNIQPVKVYEVRAQSIGSCGNINMVLYKILDGVFLNFPGVNGQTKTIPVITEPLNC
jgi:hypothetical protein